MSNGTYGAFYVDARKIEAAAIEAGFADRDGESWFDFVDVEHSKYRTIEEFSKLEDAEDWIKREMPHNCLGTGTIVLVVPAPKRCANCSCGGLWATHEYSVDDDGIIEDNALEPPCEHDR